MYAQVLDDCRRRFGPAPRSFAADEQAYLKLHPPAWASRRDPLMRILKNQDPICQQGRVVWGHLVQANQLLFQPGDDDCPASVIYSFDPWFDDHLDPLREIASRLFDLKGKNASDPQATQIGRYLAAETERQFNLPVPKQWTAGREVFVGDILVSRKHLPAGYLAEPYFPLVVDPDPSRGMLILPAYYWAEPLQAAWNATALQEFGAAVPATRRSSSMSLTTKVLIGAVGGLLLMSLMCAGLVGGMLAFFRDNQAANPWNGAGAQPAVGPWQPPGMPPMRADDLQRLDQQQRERLREMHRRMEEDALRRQHEMHDRMQENMERHRRFMQQPPPGFGP